MHGCVDTATVLLQSSWCYNTHQLSIISC